MTTDPRRRASEARRHGHGSLGLRAVARHQLGRGRARLRARARHRGLPGRHPEGAREVRAVEGRRPEDEGGRRGGCSCRAGASRRNDDEEFAEEDAWVRASEVRRVEAERMGEQDDLSDMPDFSREQLLFSRGSRPYNKKQNKRNLNLSSGRTGSRTTESSSLDQRSVVAAQNSLASVDSVANVLPEAQGDVAKSRGQAPLAPRPSHFGRDDNQLSVAIAQKMATTRITIQHQGGISSSSNSSMGSQPIFIT